MDDCWSSSSGDSSPPSQSSHSFLNHFLTLYEEMADPAGVDCRNTFHSVLGAEVLKKKLATSELLDDADLTGEDLDFVMITQSEIELIQAEVRERKVQEQERAVETAKRLNQAFSSWQQDFRPCELEAVSNGACNNHDSSVASGSPEALDCLCQFLVDLELGRLNNDSHFRANSSLENDHETSTSIFDEHRSRLLPNAFDDDKLRQKMSYLLEFRGKLDEEKWRAGVDVKLIFAYFKFLLEYLMSQATVSATQIADFKDQLSSNHDTKTSLLESRSEVDSLRIENMVLSTFLDQLTEESGSCQSRSAQTKPESHGRTDISKEELERRLEKEAAEVRRLTKELELVRWEHAAESLVYTEVVDDMSSRWSQLNIDSQGDLNGKLQKEGAKLEKLMKVVEETRWEHAAESSIYLEYLDKTASSFSQENRDLREKLSKEGEFEARLTKVAVEVKKLTQELEDLRLEQKSESCLLSEILSNMAYDCSEELDRLSANLSKEEQLRGALQEEVKELRDKVRGLEGTTWQHKAETSIYIDACEDIVSKLSQERRDLSAQLINKEQFREALQEEVKELRKKVRGLEGTTWQHKAETSIYIDTWDDIVSRLSQERRDLSAQLINKDALSVQLDKKDVELKTLKKELEIASDREAESLICLEILDVVAQEWALEVNNKISDFVTKERILEDVLEQKGVEIKRLTDDLEFTNWEHEVESLIYLEVVGERACEWRQLVDNRAADFGRKQIVRRKELQASCSFSGRTHKENLAYEDSPQGDIEGLKAALKRPSPLKGLSTLSDHQSVSSPGKSTDPIYVVVRRNTQAAVEGFMVDIGESPSKRTSKEVVSSLRLEVLDLRREKEQLLDQHQDELNKLEFQLREESEKVKLELEKKHQTEIVELQEKLESQRSHEAEQLKDELERLSETKLADLQAKLESQHRKEAELLKVELGNKFQKDIADLEVEHKNQSQRVEVEFKQKHLTELADLQEKLEREHREEAERIKVESEEKHRADLANLQQKLDSEAIERAEKQVTELEQKYQHEIAGLKEKLVSVKRKLDQGLHGNRKQLRNSDVATTENCTFDHSDTDSNLEGSIHDTLLTQFESEVVTLVAERDEFRDVVTKLESHICELQKKVTKLEGERSWLEERVPGLEKKLATEQSRLEDTVAGHAFERDQLKLIVSSHKNEQTRLEQELADLKAERNYLATAIAVLGLACRNLKESNEEEKERWRSAYVMALKDMERALSRTQKQVKEERAQKGSAESDAQRMKAEIYTMQQESKDVWRLLERTIAEHISRAVGLSQQVEFALCRKIHQHTFRFDAIQQQVDSVLQLFRQSQMSEVAYLHTVENLQRAEQEVDVLGDEVDALVALLEKVHVVLDQYAPVLLHYPGVAGVAKLVAYELSQRSMLSS